MLEPRQHGYFNINKADIYYRIYGNGKKSLFFLHGNGEDWSCFKKQIAFFSKDYTVVTMDSRGHGHSGISEKPLTIKQIAQDAAVLIKKLKLAHVTLIGFSDGGNIVLEMALNSSLSFEALIIAGANTNPKGVKFRYQLPVILYHGICELFAVFSVKIRHKADILGLMIHEPNIPARRLRTITAPVLILAGEHDMIKDRHTKFIHTSLSHSSLAIIPKANHFVFDRPANQVNQIIKTFLNTVI